MKETKKKAESRRRNDGINHECGGLSYIKSGAARTSFLTGKVSSQF